MASLIVENAGVSYAGPSGPVQALDRVSLELRSGEIVVALGPSGCGKSTLLGLMAGFQTPSQGRVLANGRPVRGPGADRGVVFQDDALMPWLNAEDNVAFGLRLRGVSREQRRSEARRMLSWVGLEAFAGHALSQMSGGMRQRLGLARALAADPDFLLLDEPLGALDALTREKMQSLILSLWQRSGKGIFLITHSIEEALFLGTELLVLTPRPGRIALRQKLGFAQRYAAGESARSIKADPAFIAMREHLLDWIFRAEEADHAAA
ncbi:taurine ABC transporter ATP-binding protein [Chromobacterium rhizoryzae]|uniref:ATP-binding cassette domain-containing protein n=1 Tax=Chromobacterium rhizoryzae TaxID=1778675 RepID=A0AAD0RNV0_9NEIS|nr:taurine ABC transporter ATP-binding protein [Chromobacterium rhizoryzae]AXT44745.1 ATP-binding cassette domain-containing protein [Chromobacterium rhizoryzae]